MLDYLLIIVIIALALAPLSQFVPSKRQREIAHMREYAAVHGLFVEFRRPPAIGPAPVAARGIIYYGKRLSNQRVDDITPGAWVRTDAGWRGVDRRFPIPPPVQDLPPEITAASVDPTSCGVYWTESTGEPGVERIRQILESWSELLIR